jgi:hypothetical protein
MTAHDRANRVILAVLIVTALAVGLWAQLAPKSFYDNFPGGGHHWVSIDGPYNEHLVRDVGGLNLALAVLTIAAFVWLGPQLIRVASVAWIVYSLPHLLYHLNHLHAYKGADKVGNVVGLSLSVLLPIVLLWFSGAQSAVAAPPGPRSR